MTSNYLTVTRQSLYDMVWSRPMTQVAQDFGISDVALAKRCRAVDVPVPPRGYWARVAAGQTPPKTPLPRYRSQATEAAARQPPREIIREGDEPTVPFGLPAEKPAPKPTPATGQEPQYATPEEADLRARIDAIDCTPSTDFAEAHPAAKRTARHLRLPWRKTLTWKRGEQRGPIVQVDVTDAQRDRAVRFLDPLLRAIEAVGWRFDPPPPPPKEPRRYGYDLERRTPVPPVYGHVVVEDEPFVLHIDERRSRSDHVLTDAEKAQLKRKENVYLPRWDYEHTGQLRLHLSSPDHKHTIKLWQDGKRRSVESQIPAILHGLLDRALENKATRLQHERWAAEERERRRREAELAERRAAHAKLTEELERQAGAWHRARYLRRYLRAARKAQGDRTWTADLQGTPTDFLAWAEHYIDQLDPLTPTPRDPILAQPQRAYYGVEETTMKNALLRLAGAAWDSSVKLAAVDTDVRDTESEDDFYP